MCKLCPFIQELCFNASIFTLIVIALDRYRGILWPLRGSYSKHRAKVTVLVVWSLSLAPAIPNLLVYKVVPFETREGKGCYVDPEHFLVDISTKGAWYLPLLPTRYGQ